MPLRQLLLQGAWKEGKVLDVTEGEFLTSPFRPRY